MNPTPSKQLSVLRGGGWNGYQPVAVSAADRYWLTRSIRLPNVGFRTTLTGRTPRI